MKKFHLISLLITGAIGGVALLLWPHPAAESGSRRPAAAPVKFAAAEPIAIFQRAFWKRPAADDHILHASQWEQPDASGAQRWFISVRPSPALVQRLRDGDAFGLVASAKGGMPEEAPEWFKFVPADMEPWVSLTGGMRVYFSKNGGPLYATGTVSGFRPGHVLPAVAAAAASQPAGRLPSTSPPSKP